MCARCSEEYLGVTGVFPLTEWCKAKIPKNAFMFSQQNALWRTGSIRRSEVSAAVEPPAQGRARQSVLLTSSGTAPYWQLTTWDQAKSWLVHRSLHSPA